VHHAAKHIPARGGPPPAKWRMSPLLLRRALFLSALVLLFVAALTPLALGAFDAQPQVQAPHKPPSAPDKRPELVAAVPTTMPPLHFTGAGNQPDGYAVELFQEVARRAGYVARFITAAGPAQAEYAVLSGQAQALPGYGISPGRQARLAFTDPFEFQPVHIFSRSTGPRLETMADLRGKRLALVESSIPVELLQAEPDIRLHITPTLPEAIFDVLSGEVDGLVFQLPLVLQAARAAGVEKGLTASTLPLLEVPRAIALPLGDTRTLAELNEALKQFRGTPEFQALYQKWHPAPSQFILSHRTLWISGGVLALLIAALLAWRFASVMRVNRRLTLALSERDSALAALRLTEERQNSLWTLSQMDDATEEEVISFALEEGVRLTGSRLGYLCFIEGNDNNAVRFHWSASAQECCAMPDTPASPLRDAGLWADCLRSLSPCIINDYPSHPGKRGLPEGHAPVLRHMAVPLAEGGKVVMVLGVGNKPKPYDEADALQLQLFLVGLWRVIQSKRDAAAVHQAKDYAENIIQGANAMAVGLDREGRVALTNAATTELTGYTQEELLGQNWFQLTRSADDAAMDAARFHKYVHGELPLPRRHEATLRTKDGGIRHITAQNSMIFEHGEPAGIITFAIDNTERKIAEQALAVSEEKFRSLAEDSPALICRFQPGGIITYVNTAYCRTFGKSQQELIGSSFLNLIPESERQGVHEHFHTLTQDNPTKSYEHSALLPGGAEAWQSWTDRAVFDEEGHVTAYQSVGIDISERKRTEAELERLHHAIEQAVEGVVITDKDGLVLFANPAFEHMFGVTACGANGNGILANGQSLLDLGRAKLLQQGAHQTGGDKGNAWRGSVSFRCPQGPTIEVELTLSAIRDEPGEVRSFVALCRDVTEKTRLERQLWQAQKMEALGTLAGGIAHDFNNILASIMGFTELAQSDIPVENRAHASLDRVLKASRRAKELVRQILSFSRRAPSERKRVHAGQAVAEALKLLQISLPKSILLRHIAAEEDCTVLADPAQIHQIVMNLCTNAAQAMQTTGGNILVHTAQVELPAQQEPATWADQPGWAHQPEVQNHLPAGRYFELVVEDNGPGIAPELLARVFDPFFTTKPAGEGTGLGLAVVHGIATGLGGDISAQKPSQPGHTLYPAATRLRHGRQRWTKPDADMPGRKRFSFLCG